MKEVNEQKKKEANTMLGAGAGLAAFGVGTTALIGVTCPICIVASPVLVGMGVAGRIKAARLQKTSEKETTNENNSSEEELEQS